jgi:hypothetical protein
MVSPLFYYQLALLAIIWLFVLLHLTCPKRSAPPPGPPRRAPPPPSAERAAAYDGPRRPPFGKDAATAVAIAAPPLAHAQLEAHAVRRPGQISQRALVVTMETPRRDSAERTGHAGLRRAHAQGDLRRGVIDMTRLEAQRGGTGNKRVRRLRVCVETQPAGAPHNPAERGLAQSGHAWLDKKRSFKAANY